MCDFCRYTFPCCAETSKELLSLCNAFKLDPFTPCGLEIFTESVQDNCACPRNTQECIKAAAKAMRKMAETVAGGPITDEMWEKLAQDVRKTKERLAEKMALRKEALDKDKEFWRKRAREAGLESAHSTELADE